MSGERVQEPYRRSAVLYDAIYRGHADDRARMAARVHDLIEAHGRGAGHRLLDVACGTGAYLPTWAEQGYEVEGVDLSAEMIEVASARHTGVALHVGDMATFDLGRAFDAVVCLGSAIGYARTPEGLDRTLANFARHAAPGGVVVVHGWVTPENWREGTSLYGELVDDPDLKAARLSRNHREGDVSVLEMHHLVATREGADYFVERHELGLFTPAQYQAAFERAGLAFVARDDETGGGRGLYVGVKRN